VNFFPDVIFLKGVSLSVRSPQAFHVSTAVQPNCDFFSTKIKQLIILVIMRIVRCSVQQSEGKWSVLGLFDGLISQWHTRRKFVYRVHAPIIAVRTHSHSICMIYDVDDIYRHVRFVPLSRLQHAIRRKSQQRANVVRFCNIYPIGVFNLTLISYCCWRE